MPSTSRGADAGRLSTSSAPALSGGGSGGGGSNGSGDATVPPGAESPSMSVITTSTTNTTPHPLRSVDTASTSGSRSPSGASAHHPRLPPSPLPSTQSSSFSRPSLLSRLSLPKSLPLPLPLRNRNRNVADFHVRPDEPYKKYSAGEHVRGGVMLAIAKPLRITHLTVSLQGFVRVFRDPTRNSRNGSSVSLPQGSSDRPRYHGQGLASIFQDEQVLSGEGRLDAGKYEFKFDLMFPDTRLPSSIDFERGTISYLITATLTRPTSIAPTTTCDRKVVFVQQVDIGLIPPPRPRTIFLEPISKRNKRKKSSMGLEKASTTPSDANELGSEADSAGPSVTTEDSNRDRPVDMRSEVSAESGRSASTAISRLELAALSQVGTTLSSPAKQQAVDDKTITASIELLKGGCLAGDMVTVRIRVQHIKRLKSMTGIVVTLFRQGKIDSGPSSIMFSETLTREEAWKAQNDDAYPKSKAGFIGLSLSSTSSVNMFRKDLDQNMAPLFVDPATLQASVTLSVKLPEDSFPTIKGVPGEMIGFKYLVEVIVDLGGKLSNQLQGSSNRFAGAGGEQNNSIHAPKRGAEMVDTTPLRREKGVISVSMETVVGNIDSSRSRKPRATPYSRQIRLAAESDDDDVIRPELGYLDDTQYGPPTPNGHMPNGNMAMHPSHSDPHYPPMSLPPPIPAAQYDYPPPSGPSRPEYTQVNGHTNESAPTYVPPPQLPNQNSMSEKERVRQAEMRLLPSQPPESAAGPSAPPADDDNIYDAEDTPQPAASDNAGEGPSAPTHDDLSAPPATQEHAEDKQEIERQRLINEASAPPDFPEDMEHRRSGGTDRRDMAPDAEPSAPVMDEEDSYAGYGVGAGPSGSGPSRNAEQLPAYER